MSTAGSQLTEAGQIGHVTGGEQFKGAVIMRQRTVVPKWHISFDLMILRAILFANQSVSQYIHYIPMSILRHFKPKTALCVI